jgi:hypothetical protein
MIINILVKYTYKHYPPPGGWIACYIKMRDEGGEIVRWQHPVREEGQVIRTQDFTTNK